MELAIIGVGIWFGDDDTPQFQDGHFCPFDRILSDTSLYSYKEPAVWSIRVDASRWQAAGVAARKSDDWVPEMLNFPLHIVDTF